MPSKVDITIIILTYNGQEYLSDILKAIRKQKIDKTHETLIIDSGSTDKTLDIISKFPEVRLHQIPNSEFGHGKTRNLAADLANGEHLVYLTHDAVPSHNRWLHEMIAPFNINPKVVGVLGKQIPRRKCCPLLKYEINGVFGNFGPDSGTTIFYKDDFAKTQAIKDTLGFYSDANSATTKEFLKKNPYKDVNYAEDQIFGRDIIKAGLYKAYAPRGSVLHSNDLKLSEYKHRMFDETLALRKLGLHNGRLSLLGAIKLVLVGSVKDTIRIMRDKSYGWKGKSYWTVVNPWFHVAKWRGVYKALKIDIEDNEIIHKYSLESQKRSSG